MNTSRAMLLLFAMTAAAAAVITALAAPLRAQDTTQAPPVSLSYRWPQRATLDAELQISVVNENASSRDSVQFAWLLRFAVQPRGTGLELRLLRFQAIRDAQLVGVPVTYADADSLYTPRIRVDSLGNIVDVLSIEGFTSGLQRELRPSLDSIARHAPAFLQSFEQRLSGARLREVVGIIWSDAIPFWRGVTLPVGEVHEFIDTTQSSVGMMTATPVKRSLGVMGYSPCAAGMSPTSCVQLGLHSQLDPTVMRERMARALASASPPSAVDSVDVQTLMHVWSEPGTLVPRAIRHAEESFIAMRPLGQPPERQLRRAVISLWLTLSPAASALHVAAAAGDVDGVVAALAAGEAVDHPDDSGRTALLVAVTNGREAVARRLIASSASVQRAHDAARRVGDADAMRWLQRHGATPTPRRPVSELASLADSAGVTEALPHLADRVAADSTDLEAQRGLATALLTLGHFELAQREARRLLARDACDDAALSVAVNEGGLRFARGEWPIDSILQATERHLRCAPRSGEVWSNLAILTQFTADSATLRRALDTLSTLQYLSPAYRRLAEWSIAAMPSEAIVAVDGLFDWLLLRLLQHEGQRRDLRVVYSTPRGALSVAGTRPVAALPWVGIDSVGWNSHAAYLEILDTLPDRLVRATEWESLRDLAANVHGGRFTSPPRPFSGGESDLRTMVAFTVFRYVVWLDPRPELVQPQELSNVDSLSRLLLRLEPAFAGTAVDARAVFAEQQGWIADVWLHRGYAWRGIPHLEEALSLHPGNGNLWNSLAYHALVAGDVVAADTALRRAALISPTLSVTLNAATIARLRGDADSALRALDRGRVSLDSLRATEPDSTWGWSLTHLPRARGDTTAARPAFSIHTHNARDAFYLHNRALALALRGDFAEADRSRREARRLFDPPGFRCLMVSLSEATRAFTPLSSRAQAWYLRYERELRTSAPCPPNPS